MFTQQYNVLSLGMVPRNVASVSITLRKPHTKKHPQKGASIPHRLEHQSTHHAGQATVRTGFEGGRAVLFD